MSLDGIERVDEYTISVRGQRVRATPEQEAQLRKMTREQQYNFLKIMVGRDAEEVPYPPEDAATEQEEAPPQK